MADPKNNNVVEDLKSQSQLGGQGVLRDAHSYPGHYIRTRESLTVVKDFYDSFDVEYDGNNNPTEVCYYASSLPHLTTIEFVADVSSSLNDKYFFIYTAQSNTKFHIWYNVDGAGTDPSPADSIGIEVPIAENDSATVVAMATRLILNLSAYRKYFKTGLTGSILNITNLNNGPINDTEDVDSGFTFDNTSGARDLVAKINLSYNGSNPIYNGQELINYRYNVYKSTFEFRSSGSTVIEDEDGDKLEINTDGSVNAVVQKDWDNFEVTARNSNGDILQVEYNMGATLVRTVDITYDGSGCLLSYTETEA